MLLRESRIFFLLEKGFLLKKFFKIQKWCKTEVKNKLYHFSIQYYNHLEKNSSNRLNTLYYYIIVLYF